MLVGGLVQGRADLADVEAGEPDAGLDEGDGVAAALVAEFDEWPVEAVEEAVGGGVVAGAQGRVEGEGDVGREAEHGGRVETDADAAVGESGEFGGGQAVEVEEVGESLGAYGADGALEEVEVAEAVLEAEDLGVPGERDDGRGREHRVVALVDDDLQGGRVGQLRVVAQQTFLAGDHEIGRHREEPVGSCFLGETRVAHGEGRAVPGARDDRHPPRGLLDGRGHARLELLGGQGVELARAAAREDRGGAGLDALAHMGAEGVEVEGAVGPEGGDREEQRPAGDAESSGERG